MDISPKVSAGVGAAGLSAPLSILVTWGLGAIGVPVPPEVSMATASLLASVLGGVAGWLVPHVQSNQ